MTPSTADGRGVSRWYPETRRKGRVKWPRTYDKFKRKLGQSERQGIEKFTKSQMTAEVLSEGRRAKAGWRIQSSLVALRFRSPKGNIASSHPDIAWRGSRLRAAEQSGSAARKPGVSSADLDVLPFQETPELSNSLASLGKAVPKGDAPMKTQVRPCGQPPSYQVPAASLPVPRRRSPN